MKKELSSKEAAAILGVSAATLYAYVSRGLLASIADGKARSKRYAREDVLRLAARKADGKRAGHAVAAAMSWGVPVLESRISLIADGKLYYRGRDSSVLAAGATLEQAAAILWGDAVPADAIVDTAAAADATAAAAAPDGLPRLPAAAAALASKMPPLERAMAFLPVLALQPVRPGRHAVRTAHAARAAGAADAHARRLAAGRRGDERPAARAGSARMARGRAGKGAAARRARADGGP
ncbi:citrate synthase [Pseudoduganella sp. UC29_71]|uniref:helix-turn-helix domain-containing protein n=1 Tax=Pseudoduganella sp. UC29_71 TaxID=3350174 RepID=UPI003672714E